MGKKWNARDDERAVVCFILKVLSTCAPQRLFNGIGSERRCDQAGEAAARRAAAGSAPHQERGVA